MKITTSIQKKLKGHIFIAIYFLKITILYGSLLTSKIMKIFRDTKFFWNTVFLILCFNKIFNEKICCEVFRVTNYLTSSCVQSYQMCRFKFLNQKKMKMAFYIFGVGLNKTSFGITLLCSMRNILCFIQSTREPRSNVLYKKFSRKLVEYIVIRLRDVKRICIFFLSNTD